MSRFSTRSVTGLRLDQCLALLCIVASLLLQSSFSSTNKSLDGIAAAAEPEPLTGEVSSEAAALAPVFRADLAALDHDEPEIFTATLSAEAIYVSDETSASILLAKQADQRRAPASTTKLMTALVARRNYQLDNIVTVRQEAFTEGNTMGLQLGEQITVENLLKGLLISSGNDAAFALANHHPLGYDGFISQMNTVADGLGLNQTSFQNPSGLDQPSHQTTARDLTILAREVMKDPLMRSIVGTQREVVTDISGQIPHYLNHTHALLGREPGVVGVKTGTTFEAGEALVTQIERDGHVVMITVLKSQDRYGDTRKIIQWIDTYYSWVELENI